MPISAELKRFDHDSQNLLPEIHANQRVAAQLDAEIEANDREVSELKNTQEVALAEMKKLRADLEQPAPRQSRIAQRGAEFDRKLEGDRFRRDRQLQIA